MVTVCSQVRRDSLVAQLVGDGVRQRDAVVFVDVAAALRLAHTCDVCHPKRAARLVVMGTDVYPVTTFQEMKHFRFKILQV